ncbi:MAG TPA: cupin domain-containing protein [Myxococcaceae bacterium]|nr:cupin domain-containing protein [Myxococcaceae bacterium]
MSRRRFNRLSLIALLGAGSSLSGAASVLQGPTASPSSRRDVIKQQLPGEPPRELTLVEVTYPPGAGSPAHLHANGVMAFVVSGTIASKVGDELEQTFKTGDAWWEPPGAVHRMSRNASSTEPAVLLAIYIAPKGVGRANLMRPI